MAEIEYKFSEYDEIYYAVIFVNYLYGNKDINPLSSPTGTKDGLLVYEPMKKNELGNPKYLDFVTNSIYFYVSEKIRNKIADIFPEIEGAPVLSKEPCAYFKAGDIYELYYGLVLPKYKFIDKKYLPEIKAYPDSTSGMETIEKIVLKTGAVKKVPEELRTMFQLDFHKVKWYFCLKNIKEKIESTGATGIKFIQSKEMNYIKDLK